MKLRYEVQYYIGGTSNIEKTPHCCTNNSANRYSNFEDAKVAMISRAEYEIERLKEFIAETTAMQEDEVRIWGGGSLAFRMNKPEAKYNCGCKFTKKECEELDQLEINRRG